MRDWISPSERARLKRIEEIQARRQRRASILGSFLMALLIAVMALSSAFNVYIIVNRVLKDKGFPGAFGVTPIVVAPSEEEADLPDVVHPGDLLFAFEKDFSSYEQGETIAFSYNGVVLVGTIDSSEADSEGTVRFISWATAHESVYEPTATQSNLLGEIYIRIPLVGYFILFLSSLPGRLIFVGIPLLVYTILMLIGFWEEMVATRQGGAEDFQPKKRKRRRKAPAPAPAATASATAAVKKAPRRRQKAVEQPSGAWLYLTTVVMTMAAIAYGTADFRGEDQHNAKRLAANAAAEKKQPVPCPCQEVILSALATEQDPDMCRPGKVHSTRPIRPRRTRGVRPITPRKVASVKPVTSTRDHVITGGR